ncbi:hypothetical protein D3C80_1126430 [compost metagenome]
MQEHTLDTTSEMLMTDWVRMSIMITRMSIISRLVDICMRHIRLHQVQIHLLMLRIKKRLSTITMDMLDGMVLLLN